MVLEAFAAIGLAGSICQFVDFSCRLFSTAEAIRSSATGAPVDIQRLDEITEALQEWSQRLASYRSSGHQQGTLDVNRNLYRLGENCESAAKELLTVTNALKVKKSSSNWATFKAALAAVWNESKIKSMEERLTSYRLQMILELELMQSNGQDSIIVRLDSLSKTNQQMRASLGDQILGLRNEVRSAIDTLKDDLTNMSPQPAGGEMKRASQVNLERCERTGYRITQSLNVLNDLRFELMDSRHAKITRSHPRTYEWIFEKKFQLWAQSTEPIFWISGKPGSGKSTLMRYLVDNERTPDLFKDWCGERKLIIATYFFWVNDTALQRSQEGLLRSLLYEFLSQCPDRIPEVLSERWFGAGATKHGVAFVFGKPWTRDELLTAFHRLCAARTIDTKFCIFIDGLDEYEGDHEDLIETVRSLQRFGVKLCVASRPWNVFEEEFGPDRATKIYMQELNRADMQLFVNDRLGGHRNFAALPSSEAEAIVSEIADKSQGVFLWVHLVVRSLLEGLRNRDGIGLLRKRLGDFPSDLNEFFRHMFTSLDPIYRVSLAHMFQIALSVFEPLSPIAYWFLDDIEESPDMALSLPVQAHSGQHTAERLREISVRVNGRSKGLMEVCWVGKDGILDEDILALVYHENEKVQAEVDFLHRTVRDFLMTSEIQTLLRSWQRSDFEPDLAICKMALAELKYITSMKRTRKQSHPVTRLIATIFISARRVELETNQTPLAYLDDLEKARVTIVEWQNLDSEDRLASAHWQSHEVIELAAAVNLQLYVDLKLKLSAATDDYKIGLIDFVLMSNVNRKNASLYRIGEGRFFAMVAMLHDSMSECMRHNEVLALVSKYAELMKSEDLQKGLSILLDKAVIGHEEFKKLKVIGDSDSVSSHPPTLVPGLVSPHTDAPPEQSLVRPSSAHKTSVDQKAELSAEPEAPQASDTNDLARKTPIAPLKVSKRKSFRASIKNLMSRLQ